MSRLKKRFDNLKKTKQKAFIAFITAGYPSFDVTRDLVLNFDKLGVDVVELGVPFSDPLADGATIQESSNFALKKGVNLNKIFKFIYGIRPKVNLPIVLMTYYNPVFRFGVERFIKACGISGVDGVIVPDLPVEESKFLHSVSKNSGVDIIHFLTPTSDKNRIKLVDNLSCGFIYYVSLTGVTGARQELSLDVKKHLKQIKSLAKKPVCVGFGVSTPEQVNEINQIADGVIVGSAIIKTIRQNIPNKTKIVQGVQKQIKKLCIK